MRTRVGHSYIKQVMAETGAIFGGEHSGHYYYRDNYRADSGIITAFVVLELLSRRTLALSELAQALHALRQFRRDQHRSRESARDGRRAYASAWSPRA